MKKILNHIFLDGLSAMAGGLFATLIIGTILGQAAELMGGAPGLYIGLVASVTKVATGAGIGVSIACRFKAQPLVVVSAGVCGLVGAYASKLVAGTLLVDGAIVFSGPGDPLGAFIAAIVGIEIGNLVAGKTSLDIIVTPICTIAAGSVVGIILGPPLTSMMTALGSIIMWAMEQQPFIMGILVSAIMGMILTLPISSAAIGIILGLSGISAGAATIGCCTQMVGFAVASFKENGVGGLISQGIGTSMLQVPNIIKHPLIWIPPTLASAILGPIGTCILKMTNNPVGSGMGTAGLVGPITSYQTMTAEGSDPVYVILTILVMYIIAPAILTYVLAAVMRRFGWIKEGDMTLDRQ